MEVTIKKTLNGLEVHPAYTTPEGQAVPMKVMSTYKFELEELPECSRRKHLDIVPFLTETQKQQIADVLVRLQQIVEQHGQNVSATGR